VPGFWDSSSWEELRNLGRQLTNLVSAVIKRAARIIGTLQGLLKLKNKRRLLVLAVAIFMSLTTMAAPAAAHSARWYVNTTFRFYQGGAEYSFVYHWDGDMIAVSSMKLKRWNTNLESHVCDHQAKTRITLPNGYTYIDYSPFSAGCGFAIQQHGMFHTTGSYPSGTAYRGYWKDTNTGGAFKYVNGVIVRSF